MYFFFPCTKHVVGYVRTKFPKLVRDWLITGQLYCLPFGWGMMSMPNDMVLSWFRFNVTIAYFWKLTYAWCTYLTRSAATTRILIVFNGSCLTRSSVTNRILIVSTVHIVHVAPPLIEYSYLTRNTSVDSIFNIFNCMFLDNDCITFVEVTWMQRICIFSYLAWFF